MIPPSVDRRASTGTDNHPRRRKGDTGWRYWAPWAYRQIVPAVAIIIAAVAVGYSADASSTAESNAAAAKKASIDNKRAVAAIQAGRKAAINESCISDERIADVVRKALLGFGVGQPGNPAPPAVAKAFEPLGGLKPLTKAEQRARCSSRVKRGQGP